MDEGHSLTPQEVAQILKIAKNTVYELIKRGELPAYKVGRKVRVDLTDVEEYKNKGKSLRTPTTASSTIQTSSSPNTIIPSAEASSSEKELIICGQDALLDILSRHLERHPKGTRALRSYVGSYNGLYELYQGNVTAASVHLWDGDTGQYNIPYVRRMLPGIPTIIIHLACRNQGFYVAKGNPKNIRSWEDLTRQDIILINREKGSGARILLDEQLRKLGIYNHGVIGYNREEFSHLSVASAVARGEADIGVGNEKAALQVQGIDFIPLQKERYELVIKKENLNNPVFQAMLEVLCSKEFKIELQGIGGYDLTETGNIVAEI